MPNRKQILKEMRQHGIEMGWIKGNPAPSKPEYNPERTKKIINEKFGGALRKLADIPQETQEEKERQEQRQTDIDSIPF